MTATTESSTGIVDSHADSRRRRLQFLWEQEAAPKQKCWYIAPLVQLKHDKTKRRPPPKSRALWEPVAMHVRSNEVLVSFYPTLTIKTKPKRGVADFLEKVYTLSKLGDTDAAGLLIVNTLASRGAAPDPALKAGPGR